MHFTPKELSALAPSRLVPIPFGSHLARVSHACGGRIPDRSTPGAFVLALWAIDGIADDEREIYQCAAQHWTLAAALTCVGDVARHIAMREPPLYPRRDGCA